MRIEGHFTADEIRSAVALGATTDKLPYKKISIKFPSQAAYERWFTAQQKTQAWGTLLLLTPKPGPVSEV